MLEISLSIVPPENWIGEVLRSHNTVVHITDVKLESSRHGVQDFVEISTDGPAADMVNRVRTSKSVIRSNLKDVGEGRLVGAVTTDACPICHAVSGVDCSLVSATSTGDGSILWELLVTDNEALNRLLGRLTSDDVGFEIRKKRELKNRKELTLRQEEILKMAFELGYFDFPKKIKLDRLSRRLGIAPSTLAEILHRAEKHIMMKHFRNG